MQANKLQAKNMIDLLSTLERNMSDTLILMSKDYSNESKYHLSESLLSLKKSITIMRIDMERIDIMRATRNEK